MGGQGQAGGACAEASDETIKGAISPDVSEVPAVAVDYAVDGETGEIMEPSEQ